MFTFLYSVHAKQDCKEGIHIFCSALFPIQFTHMQFSYTVSPLLKNTSTAGGNSQSTDLCAGKNESLIIIYNLILENNVYGRGFQWVEKGPNVE